MMSQARRRRNLRRWYRYEARYITPERGGYLDNAQPIGAGKALFRVEGEPWTWYEAYWTRISRRSQ